MSTLLLLIITHVFAKMCNSFACESGLYLNQSIDCGGPCSLALCCRQPLACNELPYDYCSIRHLNNNSSNLTFYNSLCDNGTCTRERCCRQAQTCSEANQLISLSSKCQNRGLVLATANCTNCFVTECCRLPQTCSEVRSVDSSLASTWCGKTLVFNSSNIPCENGACDATQCCRELRNCYELSPPCSSVGLTSNGANCTGSSCTVSQCCMAPQFCSQVPDLKCDNMYTTVNGSMPCQDCTPEKCCRPVTSCGEIDYTALKSECLLENKSISYQNCNGSACNTAICCTNITSCSQAYSINMFDCSQVGKDLVTNQTCNGSLCSVEVCCAPAAPIKTCGGANALMSGLLCARRGLLMANVTCSGTGCSIEVCCRPPASCADLEVAGVSIPRGLFFGSTWCSRLGLTDNFDFSSCSGETCTPDKCCAQPPSSCSEWVTMWIQKYGIIGAYAICPRGTFNRQGTCVGGVCDEKSCCRPATTCAESPRFTFACASVNGVAQDAPCSPAGCDLETCCTVPKNCSELTLSSLCTASRLVQRSTSAFVTCSGSECLSRCCRLSRTCDELTGFDCASGYHSVRTGICPPSGCDARTCCQRDDSCARMSAGTCEVAGLVPNNTATLFPCVGLCDLKQCCRQPVTCGEMSLKNSSFCGGAVDFFKSCTGLQCTSTSFCCRRAVTCAEAINTGDVKCVNGQTVDSRKLGGCPGGVCSASACCKPIDVCKDADVSIDGGLCRTPNNVLLANKTCGGPSPACNSATCCRAPVNCSEATATDNFCTGANYLPNTQAGASVCNPTCSQAQCCRAPISCVENYLTHLDDCVMWGYETIYKNCSSCHAQCCLRVPAPTPLPVNLCELFNLLDPRVTLQNCSNGVAVLSPTPPLAPPLLPPRTILKDLIVVLSPIVDIEPLLLDNSTNSSLTGDITFTLPFNQQLRAVTEYQITQQSGCLSPILRCEWQDPKTKLWSDSGCKLVADYVDVGGTGVRGATCNCSHLTVFSLIMRAKLQNVPMCQAETADYVLIGLYALVFVVSLVQFVRLLVVSRTFKGSKTGINLLFQHLPVILAALLRTLFLVIKGQFGDSPQELAGVVALGLLPSAIMIVLFLYLICTWATIKMFSMLQNPFEKLRIPFIIIIILIVGLVCAVSASIASIDPSESSSVALVGSYIMAGLSALVCLLICVFGISLVQLLKKSKNSSGHSRANRLLYLIVSLSVCLFLQAAVFVAAVESGVLLSSVATFSVSAAFAFFDLLSMIIMLVLLAPGVKYVVQTGLASNRTDVSSSNNVPRNLSKANLRDQSSGIELSSQSEA